MVKLFALAAVRRLICRDIPTIFPPRTRFEKSFPIWDIRSSAICPKKWW